ncbi:MAG: phosphoribosyltransferase family protein [Betaproteobacteria bacterium]|nr:phosphoribosyltransferase family protein [Betaproteobacteria bacterium]
MSAKHQETRICLYDAAQLARVVEDMAQRSAGLLTPGARLVVAGIVRRGVPLADRVVALLEQRFAIRVERRIDLDIKRYADDLTLIYPETRLAEDPAHAALDLTGASVLVVDDVVFRGHSMLRAVQYLAQKNAEEIRTLALVDRGAAKLPVHVDVSGVRLDVAPSDVIECCVPPYEPEWSIHVVRKGRA